MICAPRGSEPDPELEVCKVVEEEAPESWTVSNTVAVDTIYLAAVGYDDEEEDD